MDPDRADAILRPYVSHLLAGWPAGGQGWRVVDGTLALVDVSGFTNLTERLARRGKVGAEEMSDILSACFADLVSVAEGFGADLVKWGGDAVLLIFEGREHATRGALAALAMQAAMARSGRIRSTGGTTNLRMSVGLHSGLFHLFLAGFRPVDVIPAGAAVTETAALEALAEPGQVAAGAATAALLPPQLRGSRRAGAVILREAAVPIPPVPPRRADAGGELRRFLAQPIAEHLLSESREPEHRRVAVAFLEFGDTDRALAEGGPERLRDALDACLEEVQEACMSHRVTYLESDIAENGVKVLLVAGAPVGAGDEEERMLRAVGRVMTAGLPLPVRAGVTTGRVFAGDFGPVQRRTFSIKGDVVNLAARILGQARFGQLLAADEVLARSRQGYETVALEPFLVKGKREPVRASAVGQPTDAARASGSRTVLVGRERELRALTAGLEAAAAGQGSLVTLLGEPGLGKTRLVEEAIARAGPVRTVRVACLEYEAAVPYRPFRTLLRALLGVPEHEAAGPAGQALAEATARLAPDLVPWLPLLAVPVDARVDRTAAADGLDERFRAERMGEVTRLLLAALLPGPTLLVFEDAHWMDAASRGLLRELGQVAAALPWLILVTQRGTEGIAGDPAGWLRLAPLDPTEALFLAESAGVTLNAHELQALALRAGGNPLFLGQLVAAAAAPGGIAELPDSVEGLLAAQIDSLRPVDRRLLRYASVLGTSFELDLLLASLEGRFEVAPGTWTRLRDFLQVDGREARFRHALVRDAAYEGLSYRRRRELHAAAGDTILRTAPGGPDTVAGVLSLHFLFAERFEPAWHHASVAARQATAAYAHVDAKALYARALAAARRLRGLPVAEVVAAWEGLGNAHVRLGEFDQARAAFRAGRRRLQGDPLREAQLLMQEAQAWHWFGGHRQALRAVGRALRVLPAPDSPGPASLRARLLVLRAVVQLTLGRASLAVQSCAEAVQLAEQGGEGSTLAYAYDIYDSALIQVGRHQEAVHRAKALALLEELGELDQLGRVLNNLGVAAHVEGRWPEALAFYDRAASSWRRAGNHFHAAVPADNSGLILLHQGRLDEAEPLFRDALRIARAARSRNGEAPILMNLGMLATRRRAFTDAEDLLRSARAAFAEVERTQWVLMTDARIAELRLAEGEAEVALEVATRTLERALGAEEIYALRATLHRLRAAALLELGRLDEAGAALEAALIEARLKRDSYEVALALALASRLAMRSGRPEGEVDAELRALIERLGVVELPDRAPLAVQGREPRP